MIRKLYAALVLFVVAYWLGACSGYEVARRQAGAMEPIGRWAQVVNP